VAQTFDPEVPSIARTYDYLLGGKDNFPADRRTIEQITEYFGDMTLLEPGVVPSARWRPGPGQEVTRRFRTQPPRE
jgi:hypothetical protein